MVSVNTNAAAITALRTLQSTNASMDKTQAHISTGLKIGEAKDNAAYWAISTTLKSDNKSLATVKDALGLGASTVDVAYQGLNKAKDVLDEIKSKLTAATQDGVNRDTIQNEIKQLQDQLKSIATSSIFSGENWLSTDSSAVSYNANKQVVASFARDASGSVSIGTIGVDIGNVALFDASTVAGKDAILDSKQLLKGRDGSVLAVGGVADTAGNTVTAGLATAAGTHAVVVGAVGSNNTAVGTGAAAGGVAAAGVAGNAGIASTRTEAAGFAAITGTTDSGTPATDTLDITMEIDGVSKVVHVSNAAGVDSITLNDIVNAINAPVGANSFGPGVASIDPANGGSLKLTGGTTAATLNTRITALGVTGATGTPSYTGLTTAGPTTGTPATSGALTRAIGALTGGLNTGDTVEVSYTLGNGTSATATMTLGSNVTTAAQFAAAWASATNTNGITVTNPSGSNLTFTDSATRGTTSNVTINDVVVKAAGTGQIKNVDVIGGGFTESVATSVRTGALTWTDLGATDKVTLGLTKGGAALTPVTVNAGASLSDFVNNLNANGTFSADFRASVVSTNQLLITNVSTGTTSGAFGLTSVAFATSAGVPKTVATTGFGQLTSAPTATTGAFAQFTLDVNDTMDFSVQIGTGAAKNVSIDQALVNTTLGSAAGGKVDTVANFKRVLDAALTKAGVTGVTTTANAGDLTFVGTLGQSLVITGGTASQGAQTMSVDQLDISNAKLASLGATTSSQIKDVLSAYIDVVNNAINKVTSAAASLGSVASRIDLQKTFVDTLMDTIDKGVGNLIDADMSEESTKLQALQVKQQLGVQSLSIANQSAQNILSLFRS